MIDCMPSPPTPEELDASPVWSLIRAAHMLERHVTEVFGAHALTPVQFGVLSYLAATGPMTTAELARSVLVRPQSIAGVIHTMSERGLVERPGPRGRGRSSPVHLSNAGEILLAAVWPSFVQANAADALGLSTEQAATLPDTMHRLMSRLAPHTSP